MHISFTTNCASRFFYTHNTSSQSKTSSFTTKNHQKKVSKTNFLQKFQTTLSYPPLNIISSLLMIKLLSSTKKFWVNKITIFIKNSKIFISSWNFAIFQPKVHKHFQQPKNTQKLKKNHPKSWIQNNNFLRKSDSELYHFKAQLKWVLMIWYPWSCYDAFPLIIFS